MRNNIIEVLDEISRRTATTDNKVAVVLVVDLFTGLVGSVRCFADTAAFFVSGVFQNDTQCLKYMCLAHKVTFYF